jgi:hypothetical protein
MILANPSIRRCCEQVVIGAGMAMIASAPFSHFCLGGAKAFAGIQFVFRTGSLTF